MSERTSVGRNLLRALGASTALVGLTVRVEGRAGVLHVATSQALIRDRVARLMALAVESTASLVGRLAGPARQRPRGVRPATRIGRHLAMLAAAVLAAAFGLQVPAAAQSTGGRGGSVGSNGGGASSSDTLALAQSSALTTAGVFFRATIIPPPA